MKISQVSALTLSVLLLLIPIAAWIETNYLDLWHSPAFLSDLEPSPVPQTPIYEAGTILPDTINDTLTFTAADNPILLNQTTTIARNGRLNLKPGAHLYARARTQLIVEGNLNIQGTTDLPVTFSINEQYPQDKTWLGIMINDGGEATLSHALIQNGSPGITCTSKSRAAVKDSIIEVGSLGIYTETANCRISDTIIRSVFDGVIAKGIKPNLTNVDIYASHKDVLTFEN